MKKDYIKPTMRIVHMQQCHHLLAGSPFAKGLNPDSNPDNFNWDSDGLDDDEGDN